MAETLALTDHEKLMANPLHGYRRCPGDTYAIGENEYQKAIIAGQSAATAATNRSNRIGQLVGRPDGK